MQKSMRLGYEPFSEPLPISVKLSFSNEVTRVMRMVERHSLAEHQWRDLCSVLWPESQRVCGVTVSSPTTSSPSGTWLRVYASCFMVSGFWFLVYGPWFTVHDWRFMVHGFWFLVSSFRLMVYGFMVYGLRFYGFMVYGSWLCGFMVYGS